MWQRKRESGPPVWAMVAGVAAGVAALAYLATRAKVGRRPPELGGMRALERRVVTRLRNDSTFAHRGVDVSSIAPGIIELTGSVDSDEELHRAADLVHGVAGVHTVLNRLDVENTLLRKSRVSEDETATRWYGGNVGMGRRRQSAATDPDQRDDHAHMLERAMEADVE